MSRFLAILLALGCAFGAYHFTLQKSFVNPYPAVCDLVSAKIFLADEQVKKWNRICHRRSRLVTPYSPKKLVIKDINNVLGLLNVSHLEVYDSSEVKSIWRGEALETGIESEFVDSELVIFKLHPKSPGALAGLKKGDVIKTINGEQPNPWEAATESGTYLIERADKEIAFQVKASSIIRKEEVSFEEFKNKSALIQIPSFRADFFADAKIKELEKKLQNVNRLVVDLRGNAGGNFVAGLRFLSLVICQPEEVGRLVRPRFAQNVTAELPDDLRDEKQLEVLDRNKEVILKTFHKDSCYQGDLRVLVDGKTASVAELVAQALKEFKKAPLLGSPSRGQMLVGVWYPLSEVGPGVEISIPEALYLSRSQYRIEGQGVELDKVLYYNLREMQAGIDSWVRSALD
ncbi:MAG: carboxy-terminal processing protease [Bdellovibrio sp. ArHS]|uniref:S41 family peptidase n=1 Tax=Bdellovibrio sp. ArHS TaxID=1569284 RepID=UPI000583DDA0|nr:S41 family peptidase [Bdellovibrio sp. ArHS]KHD89339.1 MAG: carboxy-terminal processing protease [Bdellovibrio sp. ArHS]